MARYGQRPENALKRANGTYTTTSLTRYDMADSYLIHTSKILLFYLFKNFTIHIILPSMYIYTILVNHISDIFYLLYNVYIVYSHVSSLDLKILM